MKRIREKRFLQQIAKLDSMIENKTAEVMRWKAIATSSTAFQSGERVQSSGSKDKMGGAADIYMDLEAEIKDLINERRRIIAVIEKLPEREYKVLHAVYVLQKRYQDIADETETSYQTVTSAHGRGLNMIKNYLDKMEG